MVQCGFRIPLSLACLGTVLLLGIACGRFSPVEALTAAEIATVPKSTREYWCRSGQKAQCNVLCNMSTEVNWCNSDTLGFECVCKNGSVPGVDIVADQTIPFFKCQYFQWRPCFNKCTGDQACLDRCNELYPCGHVKADPNIKIPEPKPEVDKKTGDGKGQQDVNRPSLLVPDSAVARLGAGAAQTALAAAFVVVGATSVLLVGV